MHNVENEQTQSSTTFDPHALINVLLERKKLILGVTLLSLIIGYTFLSFQRPHYQSTALIQLNTRSIPVLGADSIVLGRVDDKSAIQSELDILGSPELTQRVIDELSLHQKQEFNSDFESTDTIDEWKKVAILRNVQSQATLKKDPLSYTVHLTFESIRPERARNIANAYAHEYLKYQIETQEAINREANEWLSTRVAELRKNVIESERAVQAFSASNDLFELDGMTLDDQQVSELNSSLVDARSEYAQSEARLAQAQKLLNSRGGIETVPEVLNSYLIQRLREQEAILLRERSELSGHFGPKHPSMQNITNEVRDLRGKIGSETRKIVKGLGNELEVAKARIESLENDLLRMRGNMGESTKQSIELDDLKREAQANRQIYASFLERLKESGQAANLKQTNAKIIAKAQLPLYPSKPNKKLIMTLFLLCGGFIGTSLALILEYFSRGFTSAQAIEDSLGIENIGMIPEIPASRRKTLSEFANENKNSIYAEALRRVLAGLQFSGTEEGQPRSVLILSSLPQEGKGWVSSSLASILAHSNKKVLLLDCDLHKKSIGDALGYETEVTLNDYLSGDAKIKDIITKDPTSGLHFIGSHPTQENIQNLLEGDKMKALIEHAHKNYDLVLVDAPPVVGLSDIFFLSGLVDACIFLVQWGKTPKHVVQHALRVLEKTQIKIIGTVLTRVDMAHYRRHEFGRGYLYKKYSDYYQDVDELHVSVADKVKSKIIKFKANS